MSVHVLQNPIKVIKIEGNLNDSNSWRKLFSKLNGDIFNGFWLIGLKSFSYYIETTSVRKHQQKARQRQETTRTSGNTSSRDARIDGNNII